MTNLKHATYKYIYHVTFTCLVSITLINLSGCQATLNLDDESNTTQDSQSKIDKSKSPIPKKEQPSNNKPKPYHKPVAKSDIVTVNENTPLKLNILSNDKYFDKKDLKIKIIQQPRYGTIDQNLIYTPIANYNGYDEFSYKITDLKNNSSTVKSYITIYKDSNSNAPIVQLPKTSISPDELAIVINDNDPVSVQIGSYYAKKRAIPNQNIVHVKIPNSSDTLSPTQFTPIIEKVKKALPDSIQAYVLTWIKPFRVGGMSITSAFAFGGYSDEYANTSGGVCGVTKSSPYFKSNSIKPSSDHGIRPTMILAGVNEDNIKTLIDRGITSDYTFPTATGYLIRTTDSLRSVRYYDFLNMTNRDNIDLTLEYIDSSKNSKTNTLKDKNDILFYFTGLSTVANIDTNSYLPGAVADHLTSYGGNLSATPGKGQMSALRWLEAGATASFGTVKEPCNYVAKFPQASALINAYFRGNTIIEAYWKSVKWPGEGIFIGEPLAKPWGRSFLEYKNGDLIIQTTWLKPNKKYSILASNKIDSNFTPIIDNITTSRYKLTKIVVPNTTYKFYKLVEN